MTSFPEFNPLRLKLRGVTAFALLGLSAVFWWMMSPDMGAVLAFAVPAVVMAVLVFLGWGPANLIAGMLALLWFSWGVMHAYVSPDDRVESLAVIFLSVVIVFAVSWVGLKVRKAKRQL